MNRRAKYFAMTLFALIVLRAEALGLGEIVVHSKLGQTLNADIPIIQNSGTPATIDEIKTEIADQTLHQKRNIDGGYARQQIAFDLISDQSDKLILKLSSRLPIKEPIVNFLLDISWQTGRMIKEVILLLDPPGYRPVSSVTTLPHLSHPQQVSVQRPDTVSTTQYSAGKYGPVQRGETLFRIAFNLRPKGKGISLEDMINAILFYNPKAFIEAKASGLMQGYVLTIPTADEILSKRAEITSRVVPVLETSLSTKQPLEKTTMVAPLNKSPDVIQLKTEVLQNLKYLSERFSSLKFSTKLNPVLTTYSKPAEEKIESLKLKLQHELFADSRSFIENLSATEIIKEEIIEDAFPEEEIAQISETEISLEEPTVEDAIEQIEQETDLMFEEEADSETRLLEIEEELSSVEKATIETKAVTTRPVSTSTKILSTVEDLVAHVPDLLIPISIVFTIILALVLWLFAKRARRNSSENVLYASLEKAESDQKTIEAIADTEQTLIEEKIEKNIEIDTSTQPDKAGKDTSDNGQNEFIITGTIPPYPGGVLEDTAEKTLVEKGGNELLKQNKKLDVDFPLSMDDTLGHDDIIIDEDDYEDLLDITSEASETETKDTKKAKPEYENDEPLTLDIDVYAEPDPDENLDPAVKEFIRETTVRMAYGDFKGVQEKIERALASEPDNPRYKLLLLNLFRTSGKTAAAVKLTDELLNKTDKLPENIRKEVETISKDLSSGKKISLA